MAFAFQKTYSPEIERLLYQYYQSLSEKDRRRFAALEAIKLGHGGIRYIAKVLACDPQTVKDGMRELPQLPDDPAGSRVRKPGGGRKKTEVKQVGLLQQVQDTIKDRIAGDPMRHDVVWTDLTPQEMSQSLREHAVGAGPRLVRRMLDGLGVARRHILQGLPGGDSPHRDAPLRHLAPLIQALLAALARHQGWMHLGLSRDTTAFACESVRLLWHRDGRRLSPNASAILLLCDGGGSNSGHKHLCKEDLEELGNDRKVPIRRAPNPAYCAKFNPIERRLCSHVTRACQGVLCDALQTVMGLIQKTKTPQGLSVTVRVLDTLYEGGRTVSEAFKKNMPIVFDTALPKWNYWAMPQCM